MMPRGPIVHGLRDAIGGGLRACRAAVACCAASRSTGDFVQIPPGTVHAILAGTLLCEIQQCSNTTYRLWDWDRRPARPLHVDEACRVTDYSAAPPPPMPVGALDPGRWHTLVAHRYFEIGTISWPARATGLVDCVNDMDLSSTSWMGPGNFLRRFSSLDAVGKRGFAGHDPFPGLNREPLDFSPPVAATVDVESPMNPEELTVKQLGPCTFDSPLGQAAGGWNFD